MDGRNRESHYIISSLVSNYFSLTKRKLLLNQYGQPMMIDLADCDALLPSVFDIRPNSDFNSDHRPYLFNSALISLSVLLGRILKAVYSPSGFNSTAVSTIDVKY
jgi:hypothetical protein